ncbi:MAG: hypothetical protein SCARUB_02758 [Candidatus Scalindua rubra]|uniref:Uncharacterized protein n=1 Tax=Candidatus Scalindua rubra TaxID=1872076 RepID=A0A1E3X926_9BACT|nr:MAG: hypothetical protein SCARUB_02758 [Candidatus Scalindua rubra]
MTKIETKKIPYRITPYHLEIRSLHDNRLEIYSPISLLVEEDEVQVVAYAPDLEIYGFGHDLVEVLEDLRKSIVDMYYDLDRDKDRLGVDLKKIWYYLSSITRQK